MSKLFKVTDDNWLSLTIEYLEELQNTYSEMLGSDEDEAKEEQIARLLKYLQKTN